MRSPLPTTRAVCEARYLLRAESAKPATCLPAESAKPATSLCTQYSKSETDPRCVGTRARCWTNERLLADKVQAIGIKRTTTETR
eukprot:2179312-Rhodomonas_salina.4